MKNTQSKIKAIKTGKEIGTMYCLGCKDYTHSFKPQEEEMADKVLREKWNCVVCRSSKSRYSKQKHNNKKWFQREHKFSNPIENMHMSCKNCKNAQVTRF